jgi:aspartate/methionine/tyrosine aminotransferase
LTEQLRIHHDYLSIMPSILSDGIATAVTEPSRRESFLGRTRALLRTNLPPLEEWIGRYGDLFEYIRPKAGAMAYVSARVDLDTLQLAERLRVEESTLIVPGEQLGLTGGFRVGYGHEIAHTLEGLGRVDRCLERAGVLRVR